MSMGPPPSPHTSVPMNPSETGWADASSGRNTLNVPPPAQTVSTPTPGAPSPHSHLDAPSVAGHSHLGYNASPSTTYHDHFQPMDKAMGQDTESAPYGWMEGVKGHNVDDDLHDPAKPLKGSFEPMRAILNVGTLIILCLALLMLFVGYPVLHHYSKDSDNSDRIGLLNKVLGKGTIYPPKLRFPIQRANSSLSNSFGRDGSMLIDPDTPSEFYEVESTYSLTKGKKLKLVFSDEFNVDGRSFYAGEDPFWEAVDLHYWATGNYEWYDPAAVYTRDGSLRVRLEQHPEHNLNFRGGMLQSWNKFCYRNGLFMARVQLPGFRTVAGLWPAIWTMGNLGRAGYGATTQGTWPYSYDVCDVGTVKNQTFFNPQYPSGWPNGTTELGGATVFNKKHNTRALSFLPGQKLSRCTCKGDDHPGPWDDKAGQYVGRSAPEIDMFEAQTGNNGVSLSQSCQMAPYNWQYNITHDNTSAAYHIFDYRQGINDINSYNGEVTQQSLSGIHLGVQQAVQHVAEDLNTDPNLDNFATYSMEYQGGPNGYVAWTSGGQPAWELYPDAIIPDSISHVGQRQYPMEPMYLIINLGVSRNFGDVDWEDLVPGFPFEMAVDWVRIYQDPDNIDVGCDPDDMPTADYINKHMEAYTNANLTVWGGTRENGGYGAVWPRNKLYTKGCDATPTTEPGDPDYPAPLAKFVPSASVTAVPGAQGDWIWK